MSIPTRVCPRCKGKGTVRAGVNARDKGQRGEREVVKFLQGIIDPIRARLGLAPIVLQRNALQAHLGGEDIHGLEYFSVEVKFCENPNVRSWWDQALSQAQRRGPDWTPVLFYRRTGDSWTVRLRAYVFTPRERDQVEMDFEMTAPEFESWFSAAYEESLGLPVTPTVQEPACTCVTNPTRPCDSCGH